MKGQNDMANFKNLSLNYLGQQLVTRFIEDFLLQIEVNICKSAEFVGEWNSIFVVIKEARDESLQSNQNGQ